MNARALGMLLALAMLLAGCSGQGGNDQTPTSGSPKPTGTTGVAASSPLPTWSLGQGWTYQVERPGEPTRTFKMIVAEDRDANGLWVVAADNRTQAVHHTIYSTNPVLGRISKTTLSPFQSGGPVEMYKFPLTDGKSWIAPFFGESMTFTAVYAGDIDTSRIATKHGFGGTSEGFRITAEGSSGQRVLYDFVDGVEWFTSFELRSATGQREITLTLTDIFESYKGEYHFFRGRDALSTVKTHAANAAPATEDLKATIADGFKDRVGLGIIYQGTSATTPPRATVELLNPSGQSVYQREFAGSGQILDLTDVAGATGDWTVRITLVGQVTLDLRAVGILIFAEGTL
jgi:hypothetical protein